MPTIAGAKAAFFDRDAVLSKMDAASRKALNKSGARLRLIAQRSMRYVNESRTPDKPRRVSSPGQPPLAVRQHPFVRKFLYYSYDEATRSVVVGPAGFSGSSLPAPGVLEHGGQGKIRNRRRMLRRIGGSGEIGIGLAGGRSTKLVPNTLMGTASVTYARLTTPAAASRANRLNAMLYGPAVKRVNVAARPFMAPALVKESSQMAALWAGSVKG